MKTVTEQEFNQFMVQHATLQTAHVFRPDDTTYMEYRQNGEVVASADVIGFGPRGTVLMSNWQTI